MNIFVPGLLICLLHNVSEVVSTQISSGVSKGWSENVPSEIKKCCNKLNERKHKKLCGPNHNENDCIDFLKTKEEMNLNDLTEICKYAAGKSCCPRDIFQLVTANVEIKTWKLILDALKYRTGKKGDDPTKEVTYNVDVIFKISPKEWWNDIITNVQLKAETVDQIVHCQEIVKYFNLAKTEKSKILQYVDLITLFCNVRDQYPQFNFFTPKNEGKFSELAKAAFDNQPYYRIANVQSVVDTCVNFLVTMDVMIYILNNVNNDWITELSEKNKSKAQRDWHISDVIRETLDICQHDGVVSSNDLVRGLKPWFEIGYDAKLMDLKPVKLRKHLKVEGLNMEQKKAFTESYLDLIRKLFAISTGTCKSPFPMGELYQQLIYDLLWLTFGGPTSANFKSAVSEIQQHFNNVDKGNCLKLQNTITDAVNKSTELKKLDDKQKAQRQLDDITNNLIKDIKNIPFK